LVTFVLMLTGISGR